MNFIALLRKLVHLLGKTALDLAAESVGSDDERHAIIKLLVTKGARVDLTSKKGKHLQLMCASLGLPQSNKMNVLREQLTNHLAQHM